MSNPSSPLVLGMILQNIPTADGTSLYEGLLLVQAADLFPVAGTYIQAFFFPTPMAGTPGATLKFTGGGGTFTSTYNDDIATAGPGYSTLSFTIEAPGSFLQTEEDDVREIRRTQIVPLLLRMDLTYTP